jgi:tRNA(Ile)-lysidine synthase
MRYLVAVSGGVDSVVLLDMLVRDRQHELIVAHFDHGIRRDSSGDARFVEGLAAHYGLEFVTERQSLGAGASEEVARQYRYAFLEREATKRQAVIATAHHADDVIETIAINIARGTGWRGVAAVDRYDLVRPLLHLSKQQIRDYAVSRRLEWVEDSTNAEMIYFRNQLRRRIATSLTRKQRHALLATWNWQRRLKRAIDHEVSQYLQPTHEYDRYLFIYGDQLAVQEILRAAIVGAATTGPTRPQLDRALLAIKTAKAGTVFEVGGGVLLRFTERTFIVELPQ